MSAQLPRDLLNALPEEDIEDLIWDGEVPLPPGVEFVTTEEVGHSRWESIHILVMRVNGELWGTEYRLGLTESQENNLFDRLKWQPVESYRETRYRFA